MVAFLSLPFGHLNFSIDEFDVFYLEIEAIKTQPDRGYD